MSCSNVKQVYPIFKTFSTVFLSGSGAARIGSGERAEKYETMGRTAPMTVGMEFTARFWTGAPGSGAEKREHAVVPDKLKGIAQDVSEQKLFVPEPQIAGIHAAVRHYAKLRSAGRTSDRRKLSRAPAVGKKTRAENHACTTGRKVLLAG